MAGPKNQKSALAALAAAGGLWAWQNRDKIRGWINSQMQSSQMQSGQGQSSGSFTGETRRIGDHYANVDSASTPGDRPAPKSYDPNI